MEPHWTEENYFAPYCAGIPGELRLVFLFSCLPRPVVKGLEPGARYRAFLVNPSDGAEQELGVAQGDAEGDWTVPQIEIRRDWLLVLERA